MKKIETTKFKLRSHDPGKTLDEMDAIEQEFIRDRAETMVRQCVFCNYEQGRVYWSDVARECNYRLNRKEAV